MLLHHVLNRLVVTTLGRIDVSEMTVSRVSDVLANATYSYDVIRLAAKMVQDDKRCE